MSSDNPYRCRFLAKKQDGTEFELSSEAVDRLDAAVRNTISRLPILEGDTIFLVAPEAVISAMYESACDPENQEKAAKMVNAMLENEKQKGGDSHGMQDQEELR